MLGLATAPSSFSAVTSLWSELLDVTATHIKRDGPDADAAQLISMAHDYAWARRKEIVALVTPFLTDESPEKVSGAIEVLYRFRSYRPLEQTGDGFESSNAAFFADLDKGVYQHFEYFRKLKSDRVCHALALYLGVSRTLKRNASCWRSRAALLQRAQRNRRSYAWRGIATRKIWIPCCRSCWRSHQPRGVCRTISETAMEGLPCLTCEKL